MAAPVTRTCDGVGRNAAAGGPWLAEKQHAPHRCHRAWYIIIIGARIMYGAAHVIVMSCLKSACAALAAKSLEVPPPSSVFIALNAAYFGLLPASSNISADGRRTGWKRRPCRSCGSFGRHPDVVIAVSCAAALWRPAGTLRIKRVSNIALWLRLSRRPS